MCMFLIVVIVYKQLELILILIREPYDVSMY